MKEKYPKYGYIALGVTLVLLAFPVYAQQISSVDLIAKPVQIIDTQLQQAQVIKQKDVQNDLEQYDEIITQDGVTCYIFSQGVSCVR